MALTPLFVMLVVLLVQLCATGDARPHVALAVGCAAALIYGLAHRCHWDDMLTRGYDAVRSGMPALVILLAIGPLISSWIEAGTIPGLIGLGRAVLPPRFFLPGAFAVTALGALFMGSGLSTIATLGAALATVGHGLDVPSWATAAVVSSGAYWGNSISPVSDCVALAPALCGSTPSDYMAVAWRDMVVLFVANLFFDLGLGLLVAPPVLPVEPTVWAPPPVWSWLPLLVVVVALLKRVPTLGAFFASAMTALAVVLGRGFPLSELPSLLIDGASGAAAQGLLNRGGFVSMMSVLTMVMLGLLFGGLLQGAGCLEGAMASVRCRLRTPRVARAAMSIVGLGLTGITGTATLSMILSSQFMVPLGADLGLKRSHMAFVLGTSATAAAGIFPWSVCGAFVLTTFGITQAASVGLFVMAAFGPWATAAWLALVQPLGLNRLPDGS